MPSSVIAHMSYDAPSQTLKVIFVSGSRYDYLRVPAWEYESIKAATSKGAYLNEHIKTKYAFRKVH